jgi:hypothetical protein
MRFALSLGGIVLLPLMALGSAPVASAAGLDLADYLEQPGVYVVLRWTEEGGFNSLAEYETRWLAAFSQRQFGEELALVQELYVAYPGSLDAAGLVRDTEFLAFSPEHLLIMGDRYFLPQDDDEILEFLEPPIAVTWDPGLGEAVSGSSDLVDAAGHRTALPWQFMITRMSSATTAAGQFDDCVDLTFSLGDWRSEQTTCRGVGLVAAREFDGDNESRAEAVSYGLAPAGRCEPPLFNTYETRMLGAYFSYYGRAADAPGLAYWAARLASEGGNLTSVIDAFGNSAEFDRRFGGLDNQTLVTNIYWQVLGRNPDPGGLAYYVGELAAGRMTLQTIALNVLDGVQGEDVAMVANRLKACGHFVGRQWALGAQAYPVLDAIIADVIAGIGTGVVGSGELQADAACGVFDDLIGNDPVVAAGVFTEAYLSGKTLYTVWFGQGFDSAGNPLPGSLPVVQELRFEPDGTLIATGLLNQSDGTSTWAVDATGLLYFGGDAANGNRIACDHSEDYIRTYFVEGREFDNVDLFFFDRDAALDFAATLTDSIPPCSIPAVATVIPQAAGGE